ncbi:hypothetical protein SAMN06265339_1318 [Desulfurobacterium pacificum]|uniref:Polymerase nucleotidyl transferase domain-containing protein n=1 Tax=Desulfurobacterium pacificum TaxID=240166 RepID=A0ABY1NQ16_9BACT|nr:nucleotidyltransferase family protein [Desulfurobacterium pacificum]SMP14299.1 hypothetical protein SAMN06265339_1318 [Desulfurobacterium pacificum]
MKNLQEAITFLKSRKDHIKKTFGVEEIAIFGSFCRNEQTEKSDIDIIVTFAKGYKTFDNYMNLKEYLEKLLSRKVDLIVKTATKPKLKKAILKEAVYV